MTITRRKFLKAAGFGAVLSALALGRTKIAERRRSNIVYAKCMTVEWKSDSGVMVLTFPNKVESDTFVGSWTGAGAYGGTYQIVDIGKVLDT